MKRKSIIGRSLLLLTGGSLLALSSAQAQTWSGAADALWSTAGNWDVAPINGNNLTFSGTENQTNTNDAGITGIGTLTLSNGGWDISLGGSFGAIAGISATGNSILSGNFKMADNANRTITLNGAAGTTTLTIADQLTVTRANNSLNLAVNGAGNTLLLGSLRLGDGSGNKIISGTANVTVSGAVTETLTGTAALVRGTGDGTLTFDGTYTSNNPTTVNGGTMLINGDASAATGAFTVGTDGTLGGTGTIGGATTVNGSIAPGQAGIGTLTVNNDVTWTGDVDWKFELDASNASDRLALTGVGSDFLKGAGSTWNFDFGGSSATGTFTLATWTGTTDFVAGDFSFSNYAPGGTFSVSGNSLIFTSGPGGGTPEIAVEEPVTTDIPSGGSRGFGNVTIGGTPASLTFTIRNTGTAALDLSGSPRVAVSGDADFTVTAQPAASVAAGGSTTFTVQFSPAASGTRNAQLSIDSNDNTGGENPFLINLSGTGQTPYEAWAGGAAFGDDANGDGISNGLAFLLGASGPNANALDLLPTVSETGGNLVLTFTCTTTQLPPAALPLLVSG
jgi:hypothetical protein